MAALIADEVVHILWRVNTNMKVEEVFVAERLVRGSDTSPQDRAEIARRRHLYPASAGSDTIDWLDPKDPGSTPAAVFASIAFHWGFADPDGAEKCLREFAKIQSAEWARQMLYMLTARTKMDD